MSDVLWKFSGTFAVLVTFWISCSLQPAEYWVIIVIVMWLHFSFVFFVLFCLLSLFLSAKVSTTTFVRIVQKLFWRRTHWIFIIDLIRMNDRLFAVFQTATKLSTLFTGLCLILLLVRLFWWRARCRLESFRISLCCFLCECYKEAASEITGWLDLLCCVEFE